MFKVTDHKVIVRPAGTIPPFLIKMGRGVKKILSKVSYHRHDTAQKIKFSIKDLFS